MEFVPILLVANNGFIIDGSKVVEVVRALLVDTFVDSEEFAMFDR